MDDVPLLQALNVQITIEATEKVYVELCAQVSYTLREVEDSLTERAADSR